MTATVFNPPAFRVLPFQEMQELGTMRDLFLDFGKPLSSLFENKVPSVLKNYRATVQKPQLTEKFLINAAEGSLISDKIYIKIWKTRLIAAVSFLFLAASITGIVLWNLQYFGNFALQYRILIGAGLVLSNMASLITFIYSLASSPHSKAHLCKPLWDGILKGEGIPAFSNSQEELISALKECSEESLLIPLDQSNADKFSRARKFLNTISSVKREDLPSHPVSVDLRIVLRVKQLFVKAQSHEHFYDTKAEIIETLDSSSGYSFYHRLGVEFATLNPIPDSIDCLKQIKPALEAYVTSLQGYTPTNREPFLKAFQDFRNLVSNETMEAFQAYINAEISKIL